MRGYVALALALAVGFLPPLPAAEFKREFAVELGSSANLSGLPPAGAGAKVVAIQFVGRDKAKSLRVVRGLALAVAALPKPATVSAVTVVVGGEKGEADALQAEAKAAFPIIADPDGSIFGRFAEGGLPRLVVTDSAGRVLYLHAGYTSGREADWHVALRAASEGRPIEGALQKHAAAVGAGASRESDLGAVDVRGTTISNVPVETWVNPAPEDTKGKFVLYDFWATWCGPCVQVMGIAERAHAPFEDRLVTIAISNEPVDVVEAFVKKRGFKQPIAVDTQGREMERLQIQGIPHGYLLDPSGTVVWQGHPMELWMNEAAELKAYLDGKKQKPANTPAVETPAPASDPLD